MATNYLIYQTEIDSSASETNLNSPKGIGGNISEKFEIKAYTEINHLHIYLYKSYVCTYIKF